MYDVLSLSCSWWIFFWFYETCNDDDFSDSDRVFPELCCSWISTDFDGIFPSHPVIPHLNDSIYICVYLCHPFGICHDFLCEILELNKWIKCEHNFSIYIRNIVNGFLTIFFKLEYTLGMIFQCKSKHIYGGLITKQSSLDVYAMH